METAANQQDHSSNTAGEEQQQDRQTAETSSRETATHQQQQHEKEQQNSKETAANQQEHRSNTAGEEQQQDRQTAETQQQRNSNTAATTAREGAAKQQELSTNLCNKSPVYPRCPRHPWWGSGGRGVSHPTPTGIEPATISMRDEYISIIPGGPT